MKSALAVIFALMVAATDDAAGRFVTYEVNGAPYKGYYAPASASAPLVLLIHRYLGTL